MNSFPLDPDGLLNPAAAAAIAALAAQWLKAYLPEWRYTNLLVLLLAVAVQLAAAAFSGGEDWWRAFWCGLLGASIATFGYETVLNLLGVAGAGPRRGDDQ
ncbi:MAG: hypothetical protein ACUVX9_12820 [Anaerolineae bacterium]